MVRNDEPPTETVCEECNYRVDEETEHCPKCGTEDPWVERYKYDWQEDVDLPVVFSFEVYYDNYELWNQFTTAVWGTRLKESHVRGLPESAPQMKYCVFHTYWKLDERLELKGPFLDKKEARET
jgi:hypothetical protein